MLSGPINQIADGLSFRTGCLAGEKSSGPWCTFDGFRMEALGVLSGNDFEHAFHIDWLGSTRIQNPILSDSLNQWAQVVFPVQLEEHIIVEIHKNKRHGAPLMTDTPMAQFELVRSSQDPCHPFNRIQSSRQVDVFGHIVQGLLFGHHGQQAGIWALPSSMNRQQHVGKPHHRIEHGVVEVQVDTNRPDSIDSLPHNLGDFLSHALVVPSTGTAEIPFRMTAEKTGHGRPPCCSICSKW